MSRNEMSYISVCSGIEAATVAWNGLGWQPLAFAEIEPFPSAVLEHHYPDVPNFGDFTTIQESNIDHTVDLIVGGTPCQSFSVAGKRSGLDDPRGNLTLEFVRLCNRIRSTWILWENVPGVLSIDSGRTFATILQALGQCGYQCAWRILDAQYFGVPQRRRRLFLVGHLGDWRRAAEVLFEPESLSGDITPSREAGQEIAGTPGTRPNAGRHTDTDTYIAKCLSTSNQRIDYETETFVTGTLMASGAGMDRPAGCASETDFLVNSAVAIHQNASGEIHTGETAYTLNTNSNASGRNTPMVFDTTQITSKANKSNPMPGDPCHTMIPSESVRRLTPVECERLQGFPDNYTRISWRGKSLDDCPDGPRYRALGNSMAVPVMRWIGERIQAVEALRKEGRTDYGPHIQP